MTISQLITALEEKKKENGDIDVLVCGYEYGYDDFVLSVETVSKVEQKNSFSGAYDDDRDGNDTLILKR